MQIEASHVITSCIRCNTSQQFLGSEEQARSAGYYACKYCSKDPVKMNIVVPVLYMMDKKRESKAEDMDYNEFRDAQYWLTRVLNNFSSMCEFSDTQIASALMGIDSFHTSHIFWSFYAKSFVNYQREHFTEEELQSVAPDIVDDDMHHIVPPDGTVDDQHRDQGETVFVTKDNELRVAMQHEHYLRRGPELKDLGPYEWAAMIRVEKKPKRDTTSSTRQRNARFEFEDDGTGWHRTHRQVLRAKFLVLHRDASQHSLGVRQRVSV